MTSHDLHSNIKVVQHLAAAAYTSTQTPSDGVDTQGFESLEFLIAIGRFPTSRNLRRRTGRSSFRNPTASPADLRT